MLPQPKTQHRRNRARRYTKKAHQSSYVNPEHMATFDGLQEWYHSMFETLGWMVLAKHYGYNDKVYTYKNSLMRLKGSIERRLPTISCKEKRKDLEIMHKNLLVLIDHAKKDF
jgi:hypothetical protein